MWRDNHPIPDRAWYMKYNEYQYRREFVLCFWSGMYNNDISMSTCDYPKYKTFCMFVQVIFKPVTMFASDKQSSRGNSQNELDMNQSIDVCIIVSIVSEKNIV